MPKLMFQPKWFETSRDIKVEDIVSFLKHDSLLSKMYQYGMITNIEYGKMVLYEEWMWNIEMQMKMLIDQPNNLQEILLIHHVDEINIMEELGMMILW